MINILILFFLSISEKAEEVQVALHFSRILFIVIGEIKFATNAFCVLDHMIEKSIWWRTWKQVIRKFFPLNAKFVGTKAPEEIA